MTVVVDASTAIKWFVSEDFCEQAQALLYQYGGDIEAPDLLIAEVANIAWKKLRKHEISTDQARAIPGETHDFVEVLHRSSDLHERAIDLAITLDHPVYDCLYVACALKTHAHLITADARLLQTLQSTEYQPMAHFVGDMPLPEDPARPLWPLTLSRARLKELIHLSDLFEQTIENAHAAYREDGRPAFLNAEEMAPFLSSPAYQRLKSVVDDLSDEERIDILALAWLGQDSAGTDIHALLEKARAYTEAGYDSRYLLSLICCLKDGLERLGMRERDA